MGFWGIDGLGLKGGENVTRLRISAVLLIALLLPALLALGELGLSDGGGLL
jgi:hypothetical protein